MDYKQIIQSKEYDVLRNHKDLKDKIILLTLGGSHAYGTAVQDSDIDIRGCAKNSIYNILSNQRFEQVQTSDPDIAVYSLEKLVSLLTACNPNTIEILGCKPEHYIILTDIGKMLLDNAEIFLSKRAVHSFGGYANQQLRRLENKFNRKASQSQQEQHIYNTIANAQYVLKDRYMEMPDDAIKLYIDKAVNTAYETEIFMDIKLTHYPLRDYKSLWSEFNNIVRDYNKIGTRNAEAMLAGRIAKHMMHLIRLYGMCLDILEKKKIITYRTEEHSLLMDIRNGKYLDQNQQIMPELYDLINDYEKRLDYAKINTELPDQPDYNKVHDLLFEINAKTVSIQIEYPF